MSKSTSTLILTKSGVKGLTTTNVKIAHRQVIHYDVKRDIAAYAKF
jgi:hypothetical protein